QAFQFWDFSHTDPTGAVQKPDRQGNPTLYTAGDLAATMAANPDLLVLSANGYYDSVTPFFQTRLTLEAMPLKDAQVRGNLTIRNYPSGHMIYLDGASRTAMKADLAAMYDRAVGTRRARLSARAALSRQVPNMIRPYFKLPGIGDVAFRPAPAGGDVCSISWGSGEANWKAAAAKVGIDYPGRLSLAAEAAARAGMIVFAASGDNDSSDGGADPANVDLPSSSPFVVGRGGTMK